MFNEIAWILGFLWVLITSLIGSSLITWGAYQFLRWALQAVRSELSGAKLNGWSEPIVKTAKIWTNK